MYMYIIIIVSTILVTFANNFYLCHDASWPEVVLAAIFQQGVWLAVIISAGHSEAMLEMKSPNNDIIIRNIG